jgi:AcrR family transcriptional regulator
MAARRRVKADDAAREERRRQVAALTLRGLSLAAIAEQLGVSKTTVFDDREAIRSEWQQERLADFDAHVDLAGRRLDALLGAVWESATTGDLDAVEVALKIEDRRAQLLGLDAPKRATIRADVTVNRDDIGDELDAKFRAAFDVVKLEHTAEIEAARRLQDTAGDVGMVARAVLRSWDEPVALPAGEETIDRG